MSIESEERIVHLKQHRPKVFGLLQNSWFYDPPRIKQAMQRYRNLGREDMAEKYRRRLLEYSLFAGCRSGRNLRDTLGDEWCDRMTWENASLELTDCASDVFPADFKHIMNRVKEERPDIIVGFGRVACDALASLQGSIANYFRFVYITAPHPTARQPETQARLRAVGRELTRLAKGTYVS